uniref:NADH-ubiquinone oxidoreductase chain 2 n=1 Tax=Dysdercus decussatus TaxID=1577203 RepID=A0A4Y1JVW7_9HEMI|nr:NADH dehydrogenase subunit 2 [Dysdercus decussatus]APO08923.1 NADH dehydrogenase subunit 2 [Dysdercus decussatus]
MNMKLMLTFSILIMSTIITLTSNNWLGMWMGMEMNLMSFIPMLSEKMNKKASQSMMIYFLTQSIGSIILLFTILSNKFIMYNINDQLMKTILIMSLMIKLGGAPFHMWLPEMMSNMSWKNAVILMTWQKIAPMTILSNNNEKSMFMFIIMSTMIGAIGGLNQTSIRKMMAYSSINHLSWMMMMMMMENNWYLYLMIYSLIIMMLFLMLNKKNILFMNQLNMNKMTIMEKMTLTTLMMSMGGLPPFIGFLPKWMTIQSMLNSSMWMMLMLMVMMSLITLFYYLRMMYPLILIYNTKTKWINLMTKSKMTIMIMLLNILLPIMLMMPMF